MAVAPQPSPLEILDLRGLRARALNELFAEEEQHWRELLHWDYGPSVEMIRRHLEAGSLPGYVALRRGVAAGYCFFVYDDDKGLLGDLYVLAAHRQARPGATPASIATHLLSRALETLEGTPGVRRLEAQLIPFGLEPLEPIFGAHGFRCFLRLFMYKPLQAAGRSASAREAPAAPGAELRPWEDAYFEPMAELIVAAYRRHLDTQINDHYGSVPGALRFLKNIVLFPGCGVFQPDCSFVAVPTAPPEGALLGAVLSSQVARGIGHITQLCVRGEWHGRGLGRRLLRAALARLEAKGCHGASLTVTAENRRAVSLYRGIGFEVIKEFSGYARDLL